MKAIFLYLLPLAFLALGCSSDGDTPTATNSCAITFRTSDDGSRAGIGNVMDMDEFRVWGWATDDSAVCTKIFNNQPVLRNNSSWNYTPPVYWFSNRSYRFLAMASSKTQGSGLRVSTPNSFSTWADAAAMNFTISAPYDEDILAASHERRTGVISAAPVPVEFAFKHLLARFRVEVRSVHIDSCHVRLRSLTFKPRYAGCTFNPALVGTTHEVPPTAPGQEPTYYTTYEVQFPVTSTTAATETYTMLSDNPAGHQMPATQNYMYLVPGQAGSFVVNYELWQDEPELMIKSYSDEFHVITPLQGGKSYKTTITLPGATSVISLQATLEPWGDENDNDREILYI